MTDETFLFSKRFRELVKIIENQELFGESYCTVYVPSINRIECVPLDDLYENQSIYSEEYLRFILCLASAQKMIEEGVILAPVGSSLIPLPHQIACLTRVIAEEKPRYLIADEVGLGKTIEAGLIIKELKLRGLIEKVLVLCPKSIVIQWVSEMKTHFNEDFRPILSEEINASQEIFNDINIWKMFPAIVCSFDSVKPLDRRHGWTEEQIERYNQHRFENLISAGWDLVIIDEAHKVAGATEGVARNRLARELSKTTPYVLLLTATPHQGKRDGFLRLMRLIDEEQFPNENALSVENVAPYVIRTEKRKAIYSDGKPIFTPRETHMISFEETSSAQEELYHAVEEYVKTGYQNVAGTYVIMFLMVLQRILTSSTFALRCTLEKRLYHIRDKLSKASSFNQNKNEPSENFEEDEEIADQLQDMNKNVLISANEVDLLQELIEKTISIESSEIDTKAKNVLELIYKIRRDEDDPSLKVLIFTEFVATQQMLSNFFNSRGFHVALINGQYSIEARQQAQTEFRNEADLLISTEAGGEGINLQFCHIIINYDLPWNPMRVEQRIGRVDRIGQKSLVKAFNFVKKDSVEEYVQSLLEEKLRIILRDFGVSKISDVLDSKVSDESFNEIYREALLNPNQTPMLLDKFMEQFKEAAKARIDISQLMAVTLDKNMQAENLWKSRLFEKNLETLVINYVKYYGGNVSRGLFGWNMRLPDGNSLQDVSFHSDESLEKGLEIIGLNHPLVANLLTMKPPISNLQINSKVFIKSLPETIIGTWSLWLLQINTAEKTISKFIPIFIDLQGEYFVPSSLKIWEKLCEVDFEITASEIQPFSFVPKHQEVAKSNAKDIFDKVKRQYEKNRQKSLAKKMNILEAKAKAIERIGIENIRRSRLKEINNERLRAKKALDKHIELVPNLSLLLILEVSGVE